jgi:hypothetical protein
VGGGGIGNAGLAIGHRWLVIDSSGEEPEVGKGKRSLTRFLRCLSFAFLLLIIFYL